MFFHIERTIHQPADLARSSCAGSPIIKAAARRERYRWCPAVIQLCFSDPE